MSVKRLSNVYFERRVRNKVLPGEALLDDMNYLFGLDKKSLKRTAAELMLNLVPEKTVSISVHKLYTVIAWLDELERLLEKGGKPLGLFGRKARLSHELGLVRDFKQEFLQVLGDEE